MEPVMIKVASSEFVEGCLDKLIGALAGACIAGDMTWLECAYILTRYTEDPRVVTKEDGVYVRGEEALHEE